MPRTRCTDTPSYTQQDSPRRIPWKESTSPGRSYFDARGLLDEMMQPREDMSLCDVNEDGLLDVFWRGVWLNAGFPGDFTNNWLEVDLEGTISNRSAVGAVATLHEGGTSSTWAVHGSSGLVKRLYFGLEDRQPDSLTIRWPSGIVQIERDLPINAIMTITEDSTLSGIGSDGPRGGSLPTDFALHQNYPNPFNPQTTIGFDVPDTGGKARVELSIYDVRGRFVRRLTDGEVEPGRHRLVWDGRDASGRPVASGIYFTTLQTNDAVYTRKMSVLR